MAKSVDKDAQNNPIGLSTELLSITRVYGKNTGKELFEIIKRA